MRVPDRVTGWVWGACLLAVLLPFGEGSASPDALFRIHSLILLGALVLALMGDPSPSRRLLPAELAAPLPALALAFLLASWNSPYPYATFLRCWDLLMAFLLFVLVRRIGWGPREREILTDCVLASSLLQALVVLGGFLSGSEASAVARWGLLNSNHQAAYLGLGIFLSAPGLLQPSGRGRALRGGAVLVCLLAFGLLASRGAVLGLAAGTLALACLSWREMSRRSRRVVAALFILVLAVALAGILRRFGSGGDPFPYERARIWRADLRCFAGNPLLGVGPGIYRHVAHRFNFPLEGPVRYGRSFETPHGDALGLLVETGIVGFAAGLFLLAGTGALLRRRARELPRHGAGLSACFAALLAQGMVEDLSARPALLLTAALLLAASSGGSAGLVPHDAPLPPGRRKGLWVAPLLLAWGVGVFNPYFAFRSDSAMRHAGSLPEMEARFAAAVRANPYQSETWRFPASAFLAADPPAKLTLDLYARFRRNLDRGIRADSTSADLFITRARLERRALQELFHDEATAGRALESYREGVKRAPHDPRPRVELAGFLVDLGRDREALEQVDRALREEPGFLRARLLRTGLLLEAGDREGARKEMLAARALRERLLSYRPDSPYAADITRADPRLEESLALRLGTP